METAARRACGGPLSLFLPAPKAGYYENFIRLILHREFCYQPHYIP
jgi:hypothetical protein